MFQEYILPTLLALGGTIITLLGTLAIAYLKKWADKLMDKLEATEAERGAVEALMAGMEKVQEDFVIMAKRAAEDGKLTAEERKEALDLAIMHAKTLAKGPALDLLNAAGKERLGAWAKQILAKWSK